MKRVVVAMSGGVDSSVAAALLKKDGFEVIGITMCFGLTSSSKRKPSCCGIEGIEDARRVAETLGIRHYVLNFHKILEEKVIKNFCQEYLQGRTPNPCVRCNQFLKFDVLLKKAKSLGTDFLATGHYARIIKSKKSKVKSQKYLLKKAKDLKKDQSYFLYAIKKEVLPFIKFPLGDLTKEEVRSLAKDFQLPVAQKPGSQEICFIDTDYREFLKQKLPRYKASVKPGPVVDLEGKVLGQHKGIPFYTMGQRQGLGISGKHPLYITDINPKTNKITVASEKYTYSRELIANNLNFLSIDKLTKTLNIKAKIRYNHPEGRAKLVPERDGAKIIFDLPQKAITPGQSVVFYDRDIVIGGGVIKCRI